jgi:hypothetical protein
MVEGGDLNSTISRGNIRREISKEEKNVLTGLGTCKSSADFLIHHQSGAFAKRRLANPFKQIGWLTPLFPAENKNTNMYTWSQMAE